MATKQQQKKQKKRNKRSTSRPTARRAGVQARRDVPQLFRLNVEVGDLEQAARFYGELFGVDARADAGARLFLDCGPVTLMVVDVGMHDGKPPHPVPKALYFTVRDLDACHARAGRLGCLSRDEVHGEGGGAITVRPWGERSFYAEDPWRNPLCFVEAGTIYPG
jgi:predicted enzyme related to lactoylglutathione lyase